MNFICIECPLALEIKTRDSCPLQRTNRQVLGGEAYSSVKPTSTSHLKIKNYPYPYFPWSSFDLMAQNYDGTDSIIAKLISGGDFKHPLFKTLWLRSLLKCLKSDRPSLISSPKIRIYLYYERTHAQ